MFYPAQTVYFRSIPRFSVLTYKFLLLALQKIGALARGFLYADSLLGVS